MKQTEVLTHVSHANCKRLGTRVEFIRSKLSNFSAHVSGVTACRPELPAEPSAGRKLHASPVSTALSRKCCTVDLNTAALQLGACRFCFVFVAVFAVVWSVVSGVWLVMCLPSTRHADVDVRYIYITRSCHLICTLLFKAPCFFLILSSDTHNNLFKSYKLR